MSICECILTGIPKDCVTAPGGIDRMWVACYNDITAKTVTDGVITQITAADDSFKAYEFDVETGSFTVTATKQGRRTVNYTTDIAVQFYKMDTPKSIEFNALAVNDTVAIVLDSAGTYWYFGFNRPLYLSAGTAQTGVAMSDVNGYNITLQDVSNLPPFEVEKTVAEGLLQ